MALTTRIVRNTGSPLYAPDGTLLALKKITFRLLDANDQPTGAFDAQTEERVVGVVIVYTDASGEFTVNLWPNDRGDRTTRYECVVDYPGADRFVSIVPSGASPLSWLDFKLAGATLTPIQLTELDNHIADLLAHGASVFSNNNATTTGLTYGYLGGNLRTDNSVVAVSAGTILLTASQTNYIEVDNLGTVTANIVGFTAWKLPMAVAVTGPASITTITDKRAFVDFGSYTGIVYDRANSRWGFGASPTHTIHVKLPSADNLYVDARTNPRTITNGVQRIEHTPGMTGTRCFNIEIDMAGYGDTHAMVVDYTLTGLAAGMYANNFQVNYTTANSTGGIADAYDVSKTGTGLAEVYAMHAGGGVNPVRQTQGAASAIEQAYLNSGAFVDATAAFAAAGTNVTLFNQANEYVYIGMAATYSAIIVSLATPASASIVPTFEYSNGAGGWVSFVPGDGTNGFRGSGTIVWVVASLTTWAQDTVNGVGGKYWVRIRRTVANLGTKPIESTISVQQGNTYYWDKNGNLLVNGTTTNVFSACPVAIPAGGTAGVGLKVSSTANFGVFFGSGAPTLAAAKGSLYLRSDGTGVSDRMYVNTDGTTGWTAVTTAA